MLIDAQNEFDREAAVTADRISTNVIDLLPGPILGQTANTIRDIGAGKPLFFHAVVSETFDTAEEDGTLDVTLESDDNTSLSSATVHITVSQIAEASLLAGTWIAKGIPLPPGDYQRYLGVRYNVGSHAFTAGKVSAWISENRQDEGRAYRSGITTGVN